MHQPRPYGNFGAASEEDSVAVEMLARRLTNIKTLSGVDSLRMVRTLPSGALAIAQDMGGVFKVIIKSDGEALAQDMHDGRATLTIPMLFSGVITRSTVIPGEGVSIAPTKTTLRRLSGYGKCDPVSLPRGMMRFEIGLAERFAEFENPKPGRYLWTQYRALRPTWYSGAMAEVMQIVGGYGRQDFDALPKHAAERARMVLPTKVLDKVLRQMGNVRLPGYSGIPPRDGKFRFDYKFHDCNGVGFDSKNKPWLLRIYTRGVFAMPLPMVPASTTAAFREYVETSGDDEILWALDRFGGLPSGEGFPPIRDGVFEAWRRAGVVIKVCDTADFYDGIHYTSASGWSFNLRGTEAFNTCYSYDEGGVQQGYAYKLSLQLEWAESSGKLAPDFKASTPDEGAMLDAYMGSVFRLLGNSPRSAAAKYKILRRPIGEILTKAEDYFRSLSGNSSTAEAKAQQEAEYWDSFEAEPIAAHKGGVRRVAQGNLFAMHAPKHHPQIKFPEPAAGGCLSHDFSPADRDDVPGGRIVQCNTIMYGYYVGDDLKVVKYFYDQRQYVQDVEDNYEECMTVGAWERVQTSGVTSLLGHFYTSDFDERDAKAPHTTTTKTVGTDLGYDTKPRFSFDDFFSMVGTLWRNRYTQHKVSTSTTEGYGLRIGVCVPFYMRNALLHAKQEDVVGKTKSESLSVYAVQDPNSYRYRTYDRIFAWVNGPIKGNAATAESVSPAPKDGSPVWVQGYNYNPTTCSDFADQGGWVGGLPADYTWLIHPIRHQWRHSGGGGAPTVREYSNSSKEPSSASGALDLSMMLQPAAVHKLVPDAGFFTVSPNVFGDLFYQDAAKVLAGSAVYGSVSEPDPESPSQRKRFGFTRLVDHKSAHHFIGVINE